MAGPTARDVGGMPPLHLGQKRHNNIANDKQIVGITPPIGIREEAP